VLSLLSPKLKTRYRAERPWILKPSEVEAIGRPGNAVITQGYPVFVEDKSRLSNYVIMVSPVMLIPIYQHYDVYEIFDAPGAQDQCLAVAVPQGASLPETPPVRVGGVLKELQLEPDDERESSVYLEALYYTPIGQES
jgi:hypothetical protein